MAKLSLTIQPDDEDWKLMLGAKEDRWSPEILRGSLALSMADVSMSDNPQARPHLDGDRISRVVLGTFLLELLEAAKAALEQQRGSRQVAIDGTAFLIAIMPSPHVVHVEVRVARKGLIRRFSNVLACEISRADLARSIKGAVEPLIKRFEIESGRPLATFRFMRRLSELLGDISRYAN